MSPSCFATSAARCSLAVIASLAIAGSAAAQPEESGDRSVVIWTGHYDLESDAGARQMLARIHHAAVKMCGVDEDAAMAEGAVAFKRCVAELTSKAVRDLDAPRVTALANEGR